MIRGRWHNVWAENCGDIPTAIGHHVVHRLLTKHSYGNIPDANVHEHLRVHKDPALGIQPANPIKPSGAGDGIRDC